MDKTNAIRIRDIYKRTKNASNNKYVEEIHCPLMIETVSATGRITSFCEAASVPKKTVYDWYRNHPLLKTCFDIAMVIAREDWEREYEQCKDEENWSVKEWQTRGNRMFDLSHSTKIVLELDETSSPWEHYQQIIRQAKNGAFSATEIKLLMESLNVGTKVFEAFKMQEEIDKMKDELQVMDQRNGHNIVAIAKTA